MFAENGMWLSLVERCVRDAKAAGSNPVIPTSINNQPIEIPTFQWVFCCPGYPGNHEFPDHEKNDPDLDFLLLMGCSFLHEFPFFKIKQQAGNCFTRYLQRREKQFPDKQFLCLLGNHNERCAWNLKPLQYRTSHMALEKSNLGIHDASRHLNREIDSQLGQKIFDLGIHDVSRC